MKSLKINRLQFSAGVVFLLAGSLEYLFSRPPGSASFLNPILSFVLYLHDTINPFGDLGFLAPDFFHPLAFALMCMALLPDTFRARIKICLAWFVIDAGLELVQKYGTILVQWLPRWFEKIPLIGSLPDRLSRGTFDLLDLGAIGAGILTALIIGQLTKGGKKDAKTT